MKRTLTTLFLLYTGLMLVGGPVSVVYSAQASAASSDQNAESGIVNLEKETGIDLSRVEHKATRMSVKIIISIFVIGLTIFLSRIGIFILNQLAERAARYRFLKKIGPGFQAALWLLSIYILIDWVFSPPKESLIAFFTASGVAIGFASQDMLKNIFGGITIILDRPFQIGDKIKVGDFYGEVIQIGLRTTRIVTPDDSVISIPNSEVVNKAVSNANSGNLDCQVVTVIEVPFGTNLSEARAIAWEAAVTSQYVYLKKPVSIILEDSPSDYSLRTRLKIKAYVVDTRLEYAFSADVAEAVKEEFRKRGWFPPTPIKKPDEALI